LQRIYCNFFSPNSVPNKICNIQQTKPINPRQRFVQEWVKDDTINFIFAPTLDNTAEIFTEIPTKAKFQKDAENFGKNCS
jgi:hypothetical protein